MNYILDKKLARTTLTYFFLLNPNHLDECVSVIILLFQLDLLSCQFLLEVIHLGCCTLQLLQTSLQALHITNELTMLLTQQVLV